MCYLMDQLHIEKVGVSLEQISREVNLLTHCIGSAFVSREIAEFYMLLENDVELLG